MRGQRRDLGPLFRWGLDPAVPCCVLRIGANHEHRNTQLGARPRRQPSGWPAPRSQVCPLPFAGLFRKPRPDPPARSRPNLQTRDSPAKASRLAEQTRTRTERAPSRCRRFRLHRDPQGHDFASPAATAPRNLHTHSLHHLQSSQALLRVLCPLTFQQKRLLSHRHPRRRLVRFLSLTSNPTRPYPPHPTPTHTTTTRDSLATTAPTVLCNLPPTA